MNSALQDLILRLQDAEKGYIEVKNATDDTNLMRWCEKYSSERHEMHKSIERIIEENGGKPEVHTSFLGELHRVFIDMKISATSVKNQVNEVIVEIERGASKLVEDYDNVLENVDMPISVRDLLVGHKNIIVSEIESITSFKKAKEPTLI